MRSHAGAASAPHMPIRNEVVSSEVGPANPAETVTANATEIATASVCVTIRSRRGSTTSVSAPAGKVRRKSGKVVATWTAETSLGLGLRLVIIQAGPVSNIANPTLESDVATRMTMKVELPSRPQRDSALDGAFGSRFNSVVKLSFVLAFEDVDPVSRSPAIFSIICLARLTLFLTIASDERRATIASPLLAPALAIPGRPFRRPPAP